jgi:hypothetical protein
MFERNDRREWSEFSDGHEPEKRRAAGAKRRPPHLRAGACPAAALQRKPPYAFHLLKDHHAPIRAIAARQKFFAVSEYDGTPVPVPSMISARRLPKAPAALVS